MNREVEFWPLEGEFDIHTQDHCSRVLLHALRIGEARQLKLRSMLALAHASIFHDTRRKDNYLDRGHGDRAAEYYREFCQSHKLRYLPETYVAIKFHDRDDELGEDYIRKEAPQHSLANADEAVDVDEETEGWLEVYRDFKDADALDRLRLGPWGLNVDFLRTEESRGMVDYAQELVEKTIDPEAYNRMKELTWSFIERIKQGK